MATVTLTWDYAPPQTAPEGSAAEHHHEVWLSVILAEVSLGIQTHTFQDVPPGDYTAVVHTVDVDGNILTSSGTVDVTIPPAMEFLFVPMNLQAQV